MKTTAIQALVLTSLISLTLTLALTNPVYADPYTLEITNLSGSKFSFTLDQLLAMPKTDVDASLYCYGALLTTGTWSGVQFSYLLNISQVSQEVASVKLAASDGYLISIPISLAIQPQVIIAYQIDNQPPSDDLRLVLPGYNGAAWIAQITSITMSNMTISPPPTVTEAANSSNKGDSTATSTPQQTAVPQQTTTPSPTPVLTPYISPLSQAATSANNTSPSLPTSSPQPTSSGDSDTIFLAVGVAFAIVLAAVGLSYRHKAADKK
jgi:DMSO/TMAO reductase YedYZ molybdopterin-dependent catalytic subunit